MTVTEGRSVWFYALWVAVVALCVTGYSQRDVFFNPYLINDDACQHIWWMRSFIDSRLFQGDLLKDYARSLQNFGILWVYYLTVRVIDPLDLARFLPFLFLPLSCGFVFFLARRITGENFSAFLVSCAFAVTPLYLQHMTGGQAHSFAYPLLTGFLYFYLSRRWFAVSVILFLSVLFFPVIFVLGITSWFVAFFIERNDSDGRVHSLRWFLFSLLTGCCVLALRFFVFNAPEMGHLLSREQIVHMPELGVKGRWAVWPVEPLWQVVPRCMQDGLSFFKGLRRSILPDHVKIWLLDGHVFLFVLAGLCLAWWRKMARIGKVFFLPVVGASLFWYCLAERYLFRLYAPDRYVAYTFSIMALFFIMIPLGKIAVGFGKGWRGCFIRYGLVVLVLGQVFLTRNAGLIDYSVFRSLYWYLRTLPEVVRVAARPDIADGIPMFARRPVYLNFELSVPLYDQYWAEISLRTRRFFQGYYAGNIDEVTGFMQREHLTHLIVDRRDFLLERMIKGIYFEPFSEEIRRLYSKKNFVLACIPDESCDFTDGKVCVMSLSGLINLGKQGHEDCSGGES